MARTGDLMLGDLVAELADHRGITIHRVQVWRFLRSRGLIREKCPERQAIMRP